MKKEIKTNAMRVLDNLDIEYEHVDYNLDGKFKSAVDVANLTHENPDVVYKTLATISKEGDIYIFVLSAEDNIDFKKAANALGIKSLSMLNLKDLRSTVGYERGATTSLAMKKDFPVIIDKRAENLDYIKVSAGKIGHGLKLNPKDLARANKARFFDICQ